MAKKLKPNGAESAEGTSNAKHNVANLEKVIKECAAEMSKIKTERFGLNERSGEIRKRLREAGVQTAAFEFALKVQDMEQEARDSYLDSLRVNFEALGIGSQGDMFVGDAKAEDQPAAPA